MPEPITQIDYIKPLFNTMRVTLDGFPTDWESYPSDDYVYSLTDLNGSYDLTLHEDELFGTGTVFGCHSTPLSLIFEARDKATNTLQYGYMGHLCVQLFYPGQVFGATLYTEDNITRYRRGLYPNHRGTFWLEAFLVATKTWDGDSWEDYYPPDGKPFTLYEAGFTDRLWTGDAGGTPIQRRVALLGGPILAGPYPMLGTAWPNQYADPFGTGGTPFAGSAVTLTIAT